MVGTTRLASIVGYEVKKGNFNNVTPNLPQKVVVLGQPNEAEENNGHIVENEYKEMISAKEVGQRYGFGSPLYNAMRILRPSQGGIGGIPTVVVPQFASESATKKKLNVEVTGSATANATHTIVVNGRRAIDGGRYDFVVEQGDDNAKISQKIVDTINAVLSAPATATQDTTETTSESALLTTKFAGTIADEFDVYIDMNQSDVGVSYSVNEIASGAGVPSIQPALETFGEEWVTIVINPYNKDVHTTLENFNGKPADSAAGTATGRYFSEIFKPFVALYGDADSDLSVDLSAHATEVTNVLCPAPNADVFRHEIAASYARVLARQAQDTPHLDVMNIALPGIPVPEGKGAGKLADYNFRDQAVKNGKSTAIVKAGEYRIKDFVTTYHPDGEVPLQFNWVRNLMIDWNVRFRYMLLEEETVVAHAIAGNDDIVEAGTVVKPKQWAATVRGLAEALGTDGLIADVDFMKENIEVQISDTNPDRFNTQFKYKRSGFGRISSTEASAGFNLG